MKDNRTYLEIKDFPKDAVVTFGDIETESYFDDKNTTVHYPDTACPLCEMEKSTIGYDAKHRSPEISNGIKIKSLCESEQACKPLFEGTIDDSVMYFESTPTLDFFSANNFEIYGEDGDMLVRINMSSGELEYGDNYNPTDACRVFWDCIDQYRKPDAWEENAEFDAVKVLGQVRRILEVPEAESIIEVARQRMGLTHKDHCNWHNWDHSCSWSASDCTCERLVSAPPGIADDMPDEYMEFKFPSKVEALPGGEVIEVEELPGGEVIDAGLEDIEYFRTKLVQALQINPDADVRKLEKQIELLEDCVIPPNNVTFTVSGLVADVVYNPKTPSRHTDYDDAMKVIK